MDSTAVVGIVSVLCSSLLGALALYVGHKAQTHSFRQALYTEQLNLIIRANVHCSRAQHACEALYSAGTAEAAYEARIQVSRAARSLEHTVAKAWALLPAEIVHVLTNYHHHVGQLAERDEFPDATYLTLCELFVATRLPARRFTGADALSEQIIKQFGISEPELVSNLDELRKTFS